MPPLGGGGDRHGKQGDSYFGRNPLLHFHRNFHQNRPILDYPPFCRSNSPLRAFSSNCFFSILSANIAFLTSSFGIWWLISNARVFPHWQFHITALSE